MPVLVVHSPEDELVPFRHGRALYEACSGRKFFLEISGGHNDGFLLSGETYVQGLDRFITAVVPYRLLKGCLAAALLRCGAFVARQSTLHSS